MDTTNFNSRGSEEYFTNRDISFHEVLTILGSSQKFNKNVGGKCPKILDTVFFQKPEFSDLEQEPNQIRQCQDEGCLTNDHFHISSLAKNDVRPLNSRQVKVQDWFYTSSDGHLYRQKKNILSLCKVYERFCKIVKVGEGDDKVLAVGQGARVASDLYSSVGANSHSITNYKITKQDFRLHIRDLMHGNACANEIFSKLVTMQPHVKNSSSEHLSYRVSFTNEKNATPFEDDLQKRSNIEFMVLRENVRDSNNLQEAVSSTYEKLLPTDSTFHSLRKALEESTMTLVVLIEDALRKRGRARRHEPDPLAHFRVESITVDYVVQDSNNMLWISNIPNTRIGHLDFCDRRDRVENERIPSSISDTLKLSSDGATELAKVHSAHDRRTLNTLLKRITILEVALANERRKNIGNECAVSDLSKYMDEVHRQLRAIETMLNSCRQRPNKDILESETVGGADENTDIYSVLPKLQSLLETSLLRFRNTTDSFDTQVLQLDTRKGCHVDYVGSLKDFMTTTFHILNSRLLLQKYDAFKCWTSSKDYVYNSNGSMCINEYNDDLSIDDDVNSNWPHSNLEGKGTISLLESESQGPKPNRAEDPSNLAISRLRETHRKHVINIESMVEDKVKLAVKKADEAHRRHHLSIINNLENNFRIKEENNLQRLDQIHQEQIEAVKAQYAQEVMDLRAYYEEREVNITRKLDDDLRTKIDTRVREEQEKAEKKVIALMSECDDRWRSQIDAQSQAHIEALLNVEEMYKLNSQRKIECITEEYERERLKWEAWRQREQQAAQENALAKERKQHAFELASLHEKYDRTLLEIKQESNDLLEGQYQKGLRENEIVYRENLEKLQVCANNALEHVKDFARCQLHDFLRQNATLVNLTSIIEQQRESAVENVHHRNDSVSAEIARLNESNCCSVQRKKQEDIIASIMNKLCYFKELAWEKIVQLSSVLSTTPAYLNNHGREWEIGHVINEMIKYVDHDIGGLRTLIEKEMRKYADIIMEYEEWNQRLEYETNWMRKQKESEESSKFKIEAELRRYQQFHERDVDIWKKLVIQSTLDKWVLVTRGITQFQALKGEMNTNDVERTEIISVLMEQNHESTEKMSLRIKTLENTVINYRERLMKIYDAIIHHKRDILMQQKNNCLDLSSKLDSVKVIKGELETKQNKLNEQLASIGDHLNDVERRIQDHCKTSVMTDGMVNEALTVRKRRLDEEYDLLVQRAAHKRNELISTDIEKKHITHEKEKLEDEMRKLEREIVEILLEQQKIILGLTSL